MILEGQQTLGPPLAELLKTSSPLEQELFSREVVNSGRVRDHPFDVDGTTRVPSIADDSWHNEHTDEIFLAHRRAKQLCKPEEVFLGAYDYNKNPEETRTPSSSSRDNFVFNEFVKQPLHQPRAEELITYLIHGCGLATEFYPVARAASEVSDKELSEFPDEAKLAAWTELEAWVRQKAGRPALKKDFVDKTGLKPLPSRWVNNWKLKEGQWKLKRRLVLKGFAERNADSMETASPTASRLGHRLIMIKSAEWSQPIISLDISTAFLQGDSIDELNASGHPRQQVAFSPPPEVFPLLQQLDPQGGWAEAALHPEDWCVWLQKGAYGLKDAPLLWFIRINRFMLEQGYVPMKHDACVYYHLDTKKQVDALISLHVDDTLATGEPDELWRLHASMEKSFGAITTAVDDFKHFGVQVRRDSISGNVEASQEAYVRDLLPMEVPKGAAATLCTAPQITAFRSLVSAIAWGGVTDPMAQAGASLYQSCLPVPSFENARHLNSFLGQLQAQYQPLVFRSDMDWKNLCFLAISDSSLGNVSKYSQGGFFVLLTNASQGGRLCGNCIVLSYKGAKSKRVASSTLHAEALALVAATEEASFLQSWFYELANPTVSTFDIINASPTLFIPIIGVVDCKDLLDVLTKSVVTGVTNRAMVLYVAALRELKETKRVAAWTWIDTRDNPANAFTKLNSDGTLPSESVVHLLRHAAWEPQQPFRWMQQLVDPTPFDFKIVKRPPPSVAPVKPTSTLSKPDPHSHG